MDSPGLSQGQESGTDGTPSRSSHGEREAGRGRKGPPPLLQDPVCGSQRTPEITNQTGEGSKNILLKDINNEKSLKWFWECSAPQLLLHSSIELNKDETTSYVNKSSFINNSESSFVLPEDEQPKVNPEPAYTDCQ